MQKAPGTCPGLYYKDRKRSDYLGNCLLEKGASLELYTISCRDLDGLASTRIAASAGCTLYTGSGKDTGKAKAFAGLERFYEDLLESIDSSFGLCLGEARLLGNLCYEIRLVVCHNGYTSFFIRESGRMPDSTDTLDTTVLSGKKRLEKPKNAYFS